MFLSLEQPIVIALVTIIALQYTFATLCLMKLARLDLPRKKYVLWNLFILLVFFIGGIVFLVYYFKVRDTLRIPEFVPTEKDDAENANGDAADDDTSGVEDEIFEHTEALDNLLDTDRGESDDKPADSGDGEGGI